MIESPNNRELMFSYFNINIILTLAMISNQKKVFKDSGISIEHENEHEN